MKNEIDESPPAAAFMTIESLPDLITAVSVAMDKMDWDLLEAAADAEGRVVSNMEERQAVSRLINTAYNVIYHHQIERFKKKFERQKTPFWVSASEFSNGRGDIA